MASRDIPLPKEVKMPQTSTLEQRLAHVEKDVNDLKSEVVRLRSKRDWIDQITGTFKDDPQFDEILRLGREIRQAERPDGE